jgi:hypothetical protein
MKRLALFFSIIIAITGTTWALKAQQRPPEKKYSVSLPLNNWVQITQQLEFIKSQLRQSDLPSKQVAFLSDSLLTPMQNTIGYQVNAQLDSERPKPEVKKDSTAKPKKN